MYHFLIIIKCDLFIIFFTVFVYLFFYLKQNKPAFAMTLELHYYNFYKTIGVLYTYLYNYYYNVETS